MTRAISRNSFDELKNYLGVYLQQGRPILDADWNENQDISVSFVRRLAREALGDGSPNDGFKIDFILPPPLDLSVFGNLGSAPSLGAFIGLCLGDLLVVIFEYIFGSLPFFISFPGAQLEACETLSGKGAPPWPTGTFALSSPQGTLRIGRDRPYEAAGFLRLSGHAGLVTITKTLASSIDISVHELMTCRFRLNELVGGSFLFFLEDVNGHRSQWTIPNAAMARDFWFAGFAAPLDLSFHILTNQLMAAYALDSYSTTFNVFASAGPPPGATTPYTWTVTAGALPANTTLQVQTDTSQAQLQSTGTMTAGTYHFTLQVHDSSGPQKTTPPKPYTLVIAPGHAPVSTALDIPPALTADFLALLMQPGTSTLTGTPADLTKIIKYGFDQVYQNGATPLVWDFDDIELGSAALEAQIAQNNFIIRGSQLSQFVSMISLLSLLDGLGGLLGGGGGGGFGTFIQAVLGVGNSEFDFSEPSIENAGRLYVAGLPCVQIRDALYLSQADPNDPVLSPPTLVQGTRKDTAYVDVWQEPVTYVDDPEIREVALGGPDTATRLRVKYRVRVNQGGGLPAGNGVGLATLATEGTYTGHANRLYLVEIDTPGDIGTATFRWSDDNASTIQRVIAAIPAGSTKVTVEDASALHPGDYILLRKEFGEEEHQILSVFSNVITLKNATGTQLGALPGATNPNVTHFTDFSLDDRPMVQRWNAFKVPIVPDPSDSTISTSIPLNDGVAVRFGGRDMRKGATAGDYWNFKTRYLAGDQATGINPVTRLEDLGFAHAQGVVHYYAQLATLVRDPTVSDPQDIRHIVDRRLKVGNAATLYQPLVDATLAISAAMTFSALGGGITLFPAAPDSQFLIIWQADLVWSQGAPLASAPLLTVTMSFYNDLMTDPILHPDDGKIQDRSTAVPLTNKPQHVDIPITLVSGKSNTAFSFLTTAAVPTSVQVVYTLSQTTSTGAFSVDLSNTQVTVIEQKKSF